MTFFTSYTQVPNAIGFVLGSAQLILYSIYKNKSGKEESEEDTKKEEEERSAHSVKGDIYMTVYEEEDGNGRSHSKNHRMLSKGGSLPKPQIIRQYSMRKLVKALSMSPYALQSERSREEEDGRNGDLDGRKNGGS